MAIDLTTDPQPAFGSESSVGTDCTQIRGPAHTGVAIFATDAVYVFNGIDEGGAAPAATARKGYTSTQAASDVYKRQGCRRRVSNSLAPRLRCLEMSRRTTPPERYT